MESSRGDITSVDHGTGATAQCNLSEVASPVTCIDSPQGQFSVAVKSPEPAMHCSINMLCMEDHPETQYSHSVDSDLPGTSVQGDKCLHDASDVKLPDVPDRESSGIVLSDYSSEIQQLENTTANTLNTEDPSSDCSSSQESLSDSAPPSGQTLGTMTIKDLLIGLGIPDHPWPLGRDTSDDDDSDHDARCDDDT